MSGLTSQQAPHGLGISPPPPPTHQIATTEAALAEKFPQVPRHVVHALVEQAYQAFAQAKIRDFVPLLAHRIVRDTLAAHPVGQELDVERGDPRADEGLQQDVAERGETRSLRSRS